MKLKKQIKRIILGLTTVLLLTTIVGCSSNNKEEAEEKDSIVDNNSIEKNPEKDNNEEIPIEEQIENDVLKVLGFSEKKDNIVRLGADDEGSDDQSVTVNQEDGDFDLFMSVSKSSTGIDSAGDGPMVGIVVKHDLKNEKESISKMEDVSKELIKVISKYEYIDWIGVTNNLLEEDGSNSRVLTVNIERETLDQVNWDRFDSDKLESIADEYAVEGALK